MPVFAAIPLTQSIHKASICGQLFAKRDENLLRRLDERQSWALALREHRKHVVDAFRSTAAGEIDVERLCDDSTIMFCGEKLNLIEFCFSKRFACACFVKRIPTQNSFCR